MDLMTSYYRAGDGLRRRAKYRCWIQHRAQEDSEAASASKVLTIPSIRVSTGIQCLIGKPDVSKGRWITRHCGTSCIFQEVLVNSYRRTSTPAILERTKSLMKVVGVGI